MITQTKTKNADGTNTYELVEDGKVIEEWTTPGPTNTWKCDCGETVERYRGEGEVQCPECDQWFNTSGQRLRNNWRGNPSGWDDEIGDMEGYEVQHIEW